MVTPCLALLAVLAYSSSSISNFSNSAVSYIQLCSIASTKLCELAFVGIWDHAKTHILKKPSDHNRVEANYNK